MAQPSLCRAACFAIFPFLVGADPTGYDSCVDAPSHGSPTSSSAGPFVISVTDAAGAVVTSYLPGAAYTVKLSGASFKGYIGAVFSGASPGSFSGTKSGSVALSTDGTSRLMRFCPGGVTQTRSTAKSSATFKWTAPAAGSGAASVWAIVVQAYASTNYNAYLTLAEAAATLPSPSSTPAAASPSPSSTPAPSASRSPSNTPPPSVAPSPSSSQSQSASSPPNGSQTRTPTPTPSQTPTVPPPSATPSQTASQSGTGAATPSGSATASVTASRSASNTVSATPAPSCAPDVCSGHGACTGNAEAPCVCDLGFAGAACDSCVPGGLFIALGASSGVGGSPLACSERPGGVSAQVPLQLQLGPGDLNPGEDGSPARLALELAVVRAASAAIPGATGRIGVLSSVLAFPSWSASSTAAPTRSPGARPTQAASASALPSGATSATASGSQVPIESPAPSATTSPSGTASATPTPTQSVSLGSSDSPSPSQAVTPSATLTVTPSASSSPSTTPSPSYTKTRPRHHEDEDDDRRLAGMLPGPSARRIAEAGASGVTLNVTLLVTPATSTASGGGASVVSLTSQLLAQVVNASSAFRAFLGVAGAGVPSLAPGSDISSVAFGSAAASSPSTPSTSDSSSSSSAQCANGPFFPRISLGPRMSIAWRLRPASCPGGGTLDAVLIGPSDVWFGLAINDGPGMVGGDAIAVEPVGGGVVSQLVLHGKTRADCRTVDESVSSLVPGSVAVAPANDSSGNLAVAYSRLLAADPCVGTALAASPSGGCPGGVSGQRAVGSGGSFVVSLVYAWGLSGRGRISTHTPATAGAVRVDLSTGEVIPTPGTGIGEVAALLLVALGGSFLLPLASAALLSRAAPRTGPAATWLRGHRTYAAAAALAALVGAAALSAIASARLADLPPSVRATLLFATRSAVSAGIAVAVASAVLLCTSLSLPLWVLPRWLGAVHKEAADADSPAHLVIHPAAAAPGTRAVWPSRSPRRPGDAGLDPCEPPPAHEAITTGLPRPSAPPASPASRTRGSPTVPAPPPSSPLLLWLAALVLLCVHAGAAAAVLLGGPILVLLYTVALQAAPLVLGAVAAALVVCVVVGCVLARCCVAASRSQARVTSPHLDIEPVPV